MRTVPRRVVVTVMMLLVSTVTTGCWDRTELNERALVMASGLDLEPDGQWLLTDQIIVPVNLAQQQGATQQNFINLSAKGRNILDAGQGLQAKLSRQYFLGHRRVIFMGEEVAKHGLEGVMDEYTRNPDVRLRSDIFVVKGDTAENALQVQTPLEQYPALSIIKSRRFVGGTVGETLLTFLIPAASLTSCPTMPVVEIVPETGASGKKTFKFTGRAIFNKQLKLVGYLYFSDANYRLWIINTLKKRQVTFFVPQGQGYATVDLSHFAGHIRTLVQNNHVHYQIMLTGQGLLRENEANLNVKDAKQLNLLNQAMEHEVTQKVTNLVTMVQKQYGTDIFGFDLALARQNPQLWKTVKSRWDVVFPNVPFSVNVNLEIKTVGLTSKKSSSAEASPDNRSW